MRKFVKWWFAATLFVAKAALAGSATLTYAASTQWSDGSTITVPVTYNIYRGAQGAQKTLIKSGVTGLSYTDTAAPNGTTQCYDVTAVASNIESATHSVEACKSISQPTPLPPTNLQVVTVEPTVYKMRQFINNYTMVAIGTVPLGTACDATHQVDGFCLINRATITLASKFDTVPLVVFAKCA